MNFLDIYTGKKVLITGHTGFKGGWLCIWLNMIGANVVGYSLDPIYEKGIFQTSGIAKKIKDYRGDVRNINNLLDVFSKEQPEIVFHLAAQPLVLLSYENPVETFEINVQGTVNILEAIRHTSSVKTAVIITSDKCYENKEWNWGYRENDAVGGYDPYSASKGAAELVINAYRKSFFQNEDKIAIASARAGNVMGGGDWAENRLIPDIIRAIKRNEIIHIRNPNAIRPWQHVLEPLSGYLKLGAFMMNSPKLFSDAWNFGPINNEVFTVKNVVEKIISYSGKGKWSDISNSEQLHEAGILTLDISKAIQKLNWHPTLSFEECLKLTVEWYFNAGNNILKFSQEQIKYFQDKWNSKKVN